MRISNKHKFIFFHIPKTGGTSISEILHIHPLCTREPVWGRADVDDVIQKYPISHYSLEQVYNLSLLEHLDVDQYFKFSFVRNPFDRLVSIYTVRQQSGKEESFCEFLDLVERIVNILRNCQYYYEDCYLAFFQEQYKFVYYRGIQVVDFIGRFENLEEDFNEIRGKLGCNRGMVHKNASGHAPYQEYYTKSLIRKVARLYAKDFELFNYKNAI